MANDIFIFFRYFELLAGRDVIEPSFLLIQIRTL